MKKGIGPQGLGVSKTPAKMYGAKSPAKKFVIEPVTETAQKKMKDDQAKSNASLVKPGFGVKKPKANIK